MIERCPHCEAELPDIPESERYTGYKLSRIGKSFERDHRRFKCKVCGGWYYYR